MEIISNIALISINETMVVQLFSFIVFIFILNRIMIRPLRSSAHDREIYIENLSVDISNAQKEMNASEGGQTGCRCTAAADHRRD